MAFRSRIRSYETIRVRFFAILAGSRGFECHFGLLRFFGCRHDLL